MPTGTPMTAERTLWELELELGVAQSNLRVLKVEQAVLEDRVGQVETRIQLAHQALLRLQTMQGTNKA